MVRKILTEAFQETFTVIIYGFAVPSVAGDIYMCSTYDTGNVLTRPGIDGEKNVEMVWTRSKDGFGKKTKIGTGGKTRRRKR
jgi:hypothetical protein